MNFIKILDNAGDVYFLNSTSIAYLKETPHGQSNRAVYKVVLKNDKQILVSYTDFTHVMQSLYGD